jgi:hypothetical protein
MNSEYKTSVSISISTDGEMRVILNQFIDKFVIQSKLFGTIPCVENRNTVALTVMN